MLYDFKDLSKKKAIKFPKISIFIFVLLLTFIRLTKTPAPPNFVLIKKEVLKHPNSPEVHLQLARLYQERNDFQNAKKELMLALSFNPSYQEAKNLLEKIRKIEEEPEKIKEEIKKWEEVLKEKPGHRDIYLKIAVLNWQIYQNQEALEAVNKALELDPNFEQAKNFKQLLSQ